MLVSQGAKSLSIWTGVPVADLTPAMRSAARSTMTPMPLR
ncbi:MAG: hypothetical protein WC378_12120 [Opitutaceae bacterium]|jgi:shikimate 5-dehydrogenase